MENVPGILAGAHASIAGRLIAMFRDIGYWVTNPPRILNAYQFNNQGLTAAALRAK
jgi:site-specific DNA-cytosine methylase